MRKRKMEAKKCEPSNNVKKRQRPRIRLKDAPTISSLDDLIELGQSISFYRNLDMPMLWRIAPHLEELNSLIGMKSLKESIFYQIIYYLQGLNEKNKNQEYLHTIITGPPGSGKTSVSKILGKIYKELGILSDKGQFKIAYREDFVADYLGQTANKTKKLLKSCIGGVLFIDELYALGPGKDDKDSFSKEAIDTLNVFLSEHKNDFCCIAAGYKEDISSCFFSVNRGLERRFPWVHNIESYTPEELTLIAIKMIDDIGWKIDKNETKDLITDIIKNNPDHFKNYGGDIENFITKSKMMHAKRVFTLPKNKKYIFTKDDFNEGIKMVKKYSQNNKKDDKPPYGMYT